MPKKIGIVGSTGSIGTQALDVVRQNPGMFKIVFLSCNDNIQLLKKQSEEFSPDYICTTGKNGADGILCGIDSLINLIRNEELDMVILAAVGAAGIVPAFETVSMGIDLALANKESVVAAGPLLLSMARSTGSRIIPVDSEHSAIFQCLQGQKKDFLDKIVLTASGGAFRHTPVDALEFMGPEQALKHPNWSMGSKITVDSATMMNKGLELIEARYLFDVLPEKLDVVIHPQSVVHSYVTFKDGSMIAQMGGSDMRTPISYAMAYPDRIYSGVKPLDLTEISGLTFQKPDMEKYACLKLATEVLKKDKSVPMIVMNAANEIAVESFIQGKLGYMDIHRVIQGSLDSFESDEPKSISDVLYIDKASREAAAKIINKRI